MDEDAEVTPASVCPECGGRKSERARICRRCYAPYQGEGAIARRLELGGALRTVDVERAHRAEWRPGHLPPACGTCRGFGYVQGLEGDPGGATSYRRNPWSGRGWGVQTRRIVAGNSRLTPERSSRAGGWHPCPDCLEHPGSACSHERWTKARMT